MSAYKFLIPPSLPIAIGTSPKGEGDHPAQAGQERGLVNYKEYKYC